MRSNDIEVLRGAGLKVTPVRVAAFEALRTATKPLTAKEIKVFLSKRDSSIDTVTVYRTLKSFEDAGLIRPLSLVGDAVSYELADDHHHHIVCLSCGLIEGFDACAFAGLGSSILENSKNFHSIARHSFELFGTCSACAARAR
jgi:Fe2+ or Zn2+ uptake regulation protein